MPNCFIIFLVLLVFALSSSCKQNKIHTVQPAGSVVSDSAIAALYLSQDQWTTKSIQYLNFDYAFTKNTNYGILRIEKTSRIDATSFAVQNSIVIEPAFIQNKTAEKAYSITCQADEAYIKDASLFIKKNGTDSTEEVYRIYHPISGKLLVSYTNDYLDLIIPNSKERRFIGFLANKRLPEDDIKQQKTSLGIFAYASSFEPILSLEIVAKDENELKKFSPYTPKIELKTTNSNFHIIDEGRRIALMNLTEQHTNTDISQIEIEITFYYGNDAKEIICKIPIVDDMPDIAHAIYDKSILQLKLR